MAIVYHCRHCGHVVGSLRQQVVLTSMLGFDMLSTEEKEQMIAYKENGDVHIQTICESCEKTLQEHPHYYELEHFLH